MFSLYGIRNIGNSLSIWKKQFETIFHLLSNEKRSHFPDDFVKFLGFTIYNARKYTGSNDWDLATAHFNFAQQIPTTIETYIKKDIKISSHKLSASHPHWQYRRDALSFNAAKHGAKISPSHLEGTFIAKFGRGGQEHDSREQSNIRRYAR